MYMATNFTPFMSWCLITTEWGYLIICSWYQIQFHSLLWENMADLPTQVVT
jgi:hypothetical protein